MCGVEIYPIQTRHREGEDELEEAEDEAREAVVGVRIVPFIGGYVGVGWEGEGHGLRWWWWMRE